MINTKNALLHLHSLLSKLPVNFRGRVCEECNWSIPTFYRKLRLVDTTTSAGKMVTALSEAEREVMLKIMKEIYDQLGAELQLLGDHKKILR